MSALLETDKLRVAVPGRAARRRIRLRRPRRRIHRAARRQRHRQIAAVAHARGAAPRGRRQRAPRGRRTSPRCRAARLPRGSASCRRTRTRRRREPCSIRCCSDASRTWDSGRRMVRRMNSAPRRRWRTWASPPAAHASSRRCRAANSDARRSRACWCRPRRSTCSTNPPITSIRLSSWESSNACAALARAGAAVVASLHDPNLALRFADRTLAVVGHGRVTASSAGELDAGHLARLYGIDYAETRARQPALHGAGASLLAVVDDRDPQRLRAESPLVAEPARRDLLESLAPLRRFLPGDFLDAQHAIERLHLPCAVDGALRDDQLRLAVRRRGLARSRPPLPAADTAPRLLRRRRLRRLHLRRSARSASLQPVGGASRHALRQAACSRCTRTAVPPRREFRTFPSAETPTWVSSRNAAGPARAGAAGHCWRARWWWRAPPAAPVRSVNRPPASSTMTVSAAMSRMFTSDSMTTSSAPRASKW